MKRRQRELSPAERRVRQWVKSNHGVLSSVAREFGLSVQFVQRIAFNREARSHEMRVEKRLRELGCPLIQKIAPGFSP